MGAFEARAVIAASLLLCGPAEAQRVVELQHVAPGRASPRWERLVIKDEKAWKEHWRGVDAARESCLSAQPPNSIPVVDFTRQQAIVASAGQRSNTSFALAITQVVDAGDRLVATVSQTGGRGGGFAGMAITYPQDVVLVERTEKPVAFVETGEDAAGRPKRLFPSAAEYRDAVSRMEGSSELQAVLRKAAGKISCVTAGGAGPSLEATAYVELPGFGPSGFCRGLANARIPAEGAPLFKQPDELAALPRAREKLSRDRLVPGLLNHHKALGCQLALEKGGVRFTLFTPAAAPGDNFLQSTAWARRKDSWLMRYLPKTDEVVYESPGRKASPKVQTPERQAEVERLRGVIDDHKRKR